MKKARRSKNKTDDVYQDPETTYLLAPANSVFERPTSASQTSLAGIRLPVTEVAVHPTSNHLKSNSNSSSIRGKSRGGRMDKLSIQQDGFESLTSFGDGDSSSAPSSSTKLSNHDTCREVFTQILAISVGTVLVIVTGIPFAAAYFPIIWSGTESSDDAEANANADGYDSATAFPVVGKEAFGLRLFLFSTMMCQLVLTFTSSFTNPIGLQIVENVPFFHVIAFICFDELGYGVEALSNLLLMLILTTILVGICFYILGALELGRAIYFIPKHVLVGLIGGIGVFIVCIGIEVTINDDFALSLAGFKALFTNLHLFAPVLFFELLLRLLIYLSTDKKTGTASFALLAPTFYCMIPPMFFVILYFFGISFDEAQKDGYFFPSVGGGSSTEGGQSDNSSSGSLWLFILDSFTDPHLFDIWNVLDIRNVSLTVFVKSFPTIIGMTLFSLVHVPIYVPAFSMTTGQDVDINGELIAHGWSNIITGCMGGLQNYMAYSNAVAYARAGGKGKISSLCVVFNTAILFVIGPSICAYIPRCMAGVILFHLGIDLVLEALVDAFDDYDRLEYLGIWCVTIVIAFLGMEMGLYAGLMTALFVYIAQSVHVQEPISDFSSAQYLRSSKWNRSADAKAVLDDEEEGSSRICIIQLQGHLFFGNLSKLNDSIHEVVTEHESKNGKAWILILDFSLVLGIDASAAMEFVKIKETLHSDYDIALCIYVTGEKRGKRFPCEYKLADDLVSDTVDGDTLDLTSHSQDQSELHRMDGSIGILLHEKKIIAADQICESLDEALGFAEDELISRVDKNLCFHPFTHIHFPIEMIDDPNTLVEEVSILKKSLKSLLPDEFNDYHVPLISNLERQVFYEDTMVWERGSLGTSAKFVVRGMLVGIQDEERNIVEEIESGQIVGETALVQNLKRTSTVKVKSKVAVLYSLSKENYNRLLVQSPNIAMCMQMITIHNLSYRAQRVTQSVFYGRHLPI